MANSTTNLPTISVSQSSKEATANALFDAHSPSSLFGRNAVTTSALTWGYLGGVLNVAGTPTQIANGTVALTGSNTNYVEATTAGVVSANTSAFTGGRLPLYTVVCGASSVTSYTDHRSSATGAGITTGGAGTVTSVAMSVPAEFSVAGSPVTTTGTLAVTKATQTANTVWAGPTSGGAAAPAFRALVAADIPAQPILVNLFYPGVPTASALLGIFAAPASITTITFAAAISGSAGKALTAATAQTDFDVRKNATTSANGTSVGTVRFAAAGTVPTFIAASGFTLTGGSDWLTVWAPASADATLADIGIDLAGTR
jgi:hypothetical protein